MACSWDSSHFGCCCQCETSRSTGIGYRKCDPWQHRGIFTTGSSTVKDLNWCRDVQKNCNCFTATEFRNRRDCFCGYCSSSCHGYWRLLRARNCNLERCSGYSFTHDGHWRLTVKSLTAIGASRFWWSGWTSQDLRAWPCWCCFFCCIDGWTSHWSWSCNNWWTSYLSPCRISRDQTSRKHYL